MAILRPRRLVVFQGAGYGAQSGEQAEQHVRDSVGAGTATKLALLLWSGRVPSDHFDHLETQAEDSLT